jgi:hypothetical protein
MNHTDIDSFYSKDIGYHFLQYCPQVMNHPVPYTILSNTMCTSLKKNNQKSGMQHVCNEADNAFFAKRLEKSNFSL